MLASESQFVIPVELTPTMEHAHRYLRFYRKTFGKRSSWIYSGVCWLFAIVVIVFAPMLSGSSSSDGKWHTPLWPLPSVTSVWFWVMLGFVGLFGLAILIAMRKQKQAFREFTDQYCVPIKLTISNEGIRAISSGTTVKWAWEAFTGYKTDGEAMLLFQGEMPVLSWLKSWFAGPGEAEMAQSTVLMRVPAYPTQANPRMRK